MVRSLARCRRVAGQIYDIISKHENPRCVFPRLHGPATIKNDSLLGRRSLLLQGWKMGLEPTTPGTTIQCSNRLSYIHHLIRVPPYRCAKIIQILRFAKKCAKKMRSAATRDCVHKNPPPEIDTRIRSPANPRSAKRPSFFGGSSCGIYIIYRCSGRKGRFRPRNRPKTHFFEKNLIKCLQVPILSLPLHPHLRNEVLTKSRKLSETVRISDEPIGLRQPRSER